jgi:hypothetical protein
MRNNDIELVLGIVALIGTIYQVFKVEAAIYDAIDELKDDFNSRAASNHLDFQVHLATYQERKQQVDYRIHGLEEKIDHKANRLFDEIKKLEQKYKSKIEDA